MYRKVTIIDGKIYPPLKQRIEFELKSPETKKKELEQNLFLKSWNSFAEKKMETNYNRRHDFPDSRDRNSPDRRNHFNRRPADPPIRNEIHEIKRRLTMIEAEVINLKKENHTMKERIHQLEMAADPEVRDLVEEENKLLKDLEKKRQEIAAKRSKKS